MGRPPAKLSPDSVPEVLGYLKAAALRTPGAFQAASRSPETRVAVVAREVAEAPPEFRHLVLGEWVLKHVTPEGRTRMFATLRRRRADTKAADKPKKTWLGLSAEDARELQALAKSLDMPTTLVVRTLVAIAAADKDLRSQMVRLGVAMKIGNEQRRQQS